ncbi:MAG: lipid II flippase MurJ, partial [Ilumatobacteraceae bacterium]
GHGRFCAYAVVRSADGVVRIVACVALAVAGVDAVGPYGLAIAFAPLPGVLWVALRGHLRTEDGPPAEWNEVTQNLGWLLAGSMCAAGLVNAGPLAVTVLAAEGQQASVTRFTYGVLLARVPLFMFQAVQAALLPRLSGLAARNEIAEFRQGLGRLLKMVLVVAVVGTIGAYVLGPFVIEKFYDSRLDGRTLAVLALSSATYMFALALAQAVIALRGHALVALGWAGAAATFVAAVAVNTGAELFARVETALLGSSVAALVLFAVALRSRLRTGAQATGISLVDAITDLPLEH